MAVVTHVARREHVLLLGGDSAVFFISLWISLGIRYFEWPSLDLFLLHITPFIPLFGLWIIVFSIAGLYGRYTRILRQRLLTIVVISQTINIVLAALSFFLFPVSIAPKTILVVYLLVSASLIILWRTVVFPVLYRGKPLHGVLLGTGLDIEEMIAEVRTEPHFNFVLNPVVDTAIAQPHEIVQQTVAAASHDHISFLVTDYADKSTETILPLMYSAAFQKDRFMVIDSMDLYQDIFERVPLSLVRYDWILRYVSVSRGYDLVKRAIDIVCAAGMGLASLIVYPFVIVAIKLDDGGPIFITQERVGRYQRPILILKFRSMSGNDNGRYGEGGTTALHVTRVGRWLRVLRIDELPQLWNILKGDLSLVGPRPELPALVAQYNARIPYYSARYLITPGLSGWAQIRHERDPHHGADVAETKAKLSYDLYYLRHRSLLLDLYILLQTVRIVITARGS